MGVVFHADGSGGAVGHEHGDGQRHNAAGALFAQSVPAVEQAPDASDARGPRNGESISIDFGALFAEAGISHSLFGGDQCELAGGIKALGLNSCELVFDNCRIDGSRKVDRDVVFFLPVVVECFDTGRAGES